MTEQQPPVPEIPVPVPPIPAPAPPARRRRITGPRVLAALAIGSALAAIATGGSPWFCIGAVALSMAAVLGS